MDDIFEDPKVKEAFDAKVEEETAALRHKRDEVMDELKSLRRQFGDIDPEKIQELLSREQQREAEEAERQQRELESKKDFEGLKEQHRAALEAKDKAIAQREQEIERLNKVISTTIAESKLREAIERAGGSAEILLPHLLPKVNAVPNDDGGYDIQVMNGGGKPLYTNKGDLAGIDDLIKEYRSKEAFAPVFRSEVQTGGGATDTLTGTVGAPDGPNPWAKETRNYTLQQHLKRHEPEKAKAFMAAAGVRE